MTKTDLAFRLLDILHCSGENAQDASFKIRSWCITVWMASLGLTMSSTFDVSSTQKVIFPFLPILLFWVLDSFQNTFRLLHGHLAHRIERAIISDEIDGLDGRSLMFNLSYNDTPYKFKLRAFFTVLFTWETVVVFYAVLTTVTLIALLV